MLIVLLYSLLYRVPGPALATRTVSLKSHLHYSTWYVEYPFKYQMMKKLLLSLVVTTLLKIQVVHAFAFVHPSSVVCAVRVPSTSSSASSRAVSSSSSSTRLFETSSAAADADAAAQYALLTVITDATNTTSTIDDTETVSDTDNTDTNTESTETSTGQITVPFPVIHYTVPNYKVGWRDQKTKQWYFVDGPRNGPPQNYWRQKADENDYNRDMVTVMNVLSEFDVYDSIRRLEKRRSTRKPSLSRKILGTWAPILMNGINVSIRNMEKPIFDDEEKNVDVPYLIEICRSNGRKFGPKNHYGIFDLKLEHGEDLTVRVLSADERMDLDCEFHTVVNEDNNVHVLGVIPTTTTTTTTSEGQEEKKEDTDNYDDGLQIHNTHSATLSLGSITYITDYVMIQRNENGAIDFWVRADESYLGVT